MILYDELRGEDEFESGSGMVGERQRKERERRYVEGPLGFVAFIF